MSGPSRNFCCWYFRSLHKSPAAQPQAREDPVLDFQTRAVIIVEAVLTEPQALAHGGQQAHLGIAVDEPARPHVAAHKRLVELISPCTPGG